MLKLEELDPRLQAAIQNIKGQRPRRVVEHILEHGMVTTEDLKKMGYEHPPRAARDVRECGVPLVTTRVASSDGKKIAAYTFGDPSKIEGHKLHGRTVLPKELRDLLFSLQNGRCSVCYQVYDAHYLQIDHRVPYEIAGDAAEPDDTPSFMLLCASCQRKKSWSCEQCNNWVTKNEHKCRACFWANPADYTHVAMKDIRLLTLTFSEGDARKFDQLRAQLSPEELADAARAAILSLAEHPRR